MARLHRVNDCPDMRGTPLQHRSRRWILQFRSEYLLVWARSLEVALDECVDWALENEPGMLCDDEVDAEYHRLLGEGHSPERAYELASVDTTCAGNGGNHIPSEDWSIVAEDPDRETIKAIQER